MGTWNDEMLFPQKILILNKQHLFLNNITHNLCNIIYRKYGNCIPKLI